MSKLLLGVEKFAAAAAAAGDKRDFLGGVGGVTCSCSFEVAN